MYIFYEFMLFYVKENIYLIKYNLCSYLSCFILKKSLIK